MIKLVENSTEASLVLEHLNIDLASILASKMFTEGFGVKQEFLQFYVAFNDNGKLCASFIKCNDRLFCLIETLYNIEEIQLFIEGFYNFKIFINSEFAYIINRKEYNLCSLMKKCIDLNMDSYTPEEIDSRTFTDIIMQGKDRDSYIRFLLNNSHLVRHGFLKNYAKNINGEFVSIASVYSNKSHCYLCNVFTKEKYRNKGYALDLIKELTENNKEYHLICSSDIAPFYNKCGFTIYSEWAEFLY